MLQQIDKAPETIQDYPDTIGILQLPYKLKIPRNFGERAALLSNYTLVDWETVIDEVHAVVAPGSPTEQTSYQMYVQNPDGNNRQPLMAPVDRTPFVERSISKIAELSTVVTADTVEAFLRRLANVVGLMIVEAHPYRDGNGRTARTVAQLVRGDINSQDYDDDLQLVAKSRPTEGYRINSFRKRHDAMPPDSIIDALISSDIPLSDTIAYTKRVHDVIWTPYGE
ncbi:MAG TPA: Fic family protein [Candidatus Saccharibacteria bacterium]|nr:Fic family protein [Candidatus Saccharibacteria bacterium]HPR10674.1 Fic family protein [Candidatus Saccharibacteria bacterium]